MMKINNFRGDLTDASAENIAVPDHCNLLDQCVDVTNTFLIVLFMSFVRLSNHS